MINIFEEIKKFYQDIETYIYISKTEKEILKEKYKKLFKKISGNIFYKIKYYRHYKYYKNFDKNIEKLNTNKIENKIISDSKLLDDIKGYSLDFDQKKAIYMDEDNILVIAGAGSGKSLTIIGKIRYLIEERNIKEDEILCISFTNASTKSLKDSIFDTFGYNIDVKTFHKLSLDIIREEEFAIANSDFLEYMVDEIFSSTSSILLENNYLYSYVKKNIVTFIHLFKSYGYENNKFLDFYKKINKENNKKIRQKQINIIKIIEIFYNLYQKELYSRQELDFDDMINKATDYVNKYGLYKNYKYIIIDEYQDTSYTRYKLINAIRKCCNSKIMAVGDDFQSIYRFSGCNLDIFLNFSKYFGYTKIIKIRNTYRNSKELIDVAGKFIMKNPQQIKKKLISNKTIEKPIKIYYYKNIKKEIINLIKKINIKKESEILILGRNNSDIKSILSENLIQKEDNLYLKENKKINIKFLTVHKSKGLEAENVIIINVIDDKLGFPNKINNDEIISLVLNKNIFPYEEERRLFYVALTRTKNSVYIMTEENKESIFVRELKNYFSNGIQIIKQD